MIIDIIFLSETKIKKKINCDMLNILYLLSFWNSQIFSIELIWDIATFLKSLAIDTRFIVTLIFDNNFRLQLKRDAFK